MPKLTPTKRVLFVRRFIPVLLVLFAVLSTLALNLRTPHTASAATQSTINFQARLQSISGAIVPDGSYNVEFKLYSASSGGAALWTEDYYDSNGVTAGNDNRVTVTNGYLTVSLGSQTAFPGTINWDQQLWLTMNVGGTTQTATPTYDGEMNPRLALTAVPYAFKAGQLAQFNSGNGFTSILNLVQPTVGNQTFQIPDQGVAGTFDLLTSNSGIKLQGSTPGTAQTGHFNISGTGKADTFNATTALQTAGVTRVDASGNLTNIVDITGTGTLKLSGTGTSYLMGALGIGTTNPQAGAGMTLANGSWISGVDSAGTGYVNMFQVNSNNQIQVGAALNIDGGIVLPTNGGQLTFADLPIDATATAGTAESYTFRIGSSNVLTVYGEADGSGNLQNGRVAIGSSIAPAYPLDVTGDINSSTGLRVGGTTVCTSTGCTAATGSGSYIQNTTSLQTSSNFWISGTGKADTALQAPTVQSAAATALTITGNAASTWSTSAGLLTINGAAGVTMGLGTGNFILNGAAASTYTLGAATTTGTITIGGTAQTGDLILGSSSGTNTVKIANGSGAGTVNIANVQTGGAVNIGAGMTTGTITIGGTGAQTGTIAIGTGTGAQTISVGTGSGAKTITVGSTNAGSTANLVGGASSIAVANGGITVTGNTTSNGTFSTSVGGATGAGLQALASNLYIQSRGTGLVTNGTGLLGNNYNFSSFTYSQTDKPVGATGSFIGPLNSSNTSLQTNELVPVSPSKYYEISVDAKQIAGSARFYLDLAPYDTDGLSILPQHYMIQANTTTTLAAPLNPGDTTMTLTDASNWNNTAPAGSSYNRAAIFWDYTDGKGYTWPAGTYSRNLSGNDFYPIGGISGNVITLNVPYAGTAHAAGTQVSNGTAGANFMYPVSNVLLNGNWTTYSNRFGGGAMSTFSTAAASTKLPIATASVKVGFLMNYNLVTGPSQQGVGNVSLVEVEAGYAKFTGPTALRTFTLPDADGTLLTTNTGIQLQGSTPGTAQTGNINITGTAIASTSVLTALVDTVGATTLTLGGTASNISLADDTVLAAGKSITISGGNTASRPGSPVEGMLYFDTTTKKLLTYSNGKWQADRTTAILVAASDSSQADKDAADYVAGASNAQTTIASAIASLPGSSGGTVYLMAGTYNFGANLNITRPGVTLTGSPNQGAHVVRAFDGTTLANGSLIKVNEIASVTIQGLSFSGASATYTNSFNNTIYSTLNASLVHATSNVFNDQAGYGVYFDGDGGRNADNNVAQDNRFQGGWGGVFANQNDHIQVIGNRFADNAHHAISLDFSNQSVVSGNTVRTAGDTGIHIGQGDNASVTGNTVRDSAYGFSGGSWGMTLSGNTFQNNTNVGINVGGFVSGATISDNSVTSNGYGIIINSGDSEITITGNNVVWSTHYGVGIESSTNTHGVTISSNTISENGEQGIYFNNTVSDNIISNNNIVDNGGAGAYSSIHLNTTGSGNSITGNVIRDSAGTGYAIAIAASTSNTYLADNTFSGTGAATINNASGSTIFSSQTISATGNFMVRNGANSTTAFQIQNAAGTSNLFNADTTNSRVGIGTAAPAYTLDVVGDINSSTALKVGGTTVCTSTGCTPASGSGNYIQNQSAGAQATSNFWISGTGRADTSLLTSLVDAATISALNIGTGNASAITIGNVANTVTTTVVANTTLNLNAPTIATNATSLALFNTTATTVNAFGAGTSIDIGATSGTTYLHTPTLMLGGIGIDTITGAGSAGLLINTAAYSAASSSSGTVMLRSGNVSGATSNTGTVTIRSGHSSTSGNTGDVSILSGDATSGNSGNVSIDVGAASATKGTITIGGTTATTVNIGKAGSAIGVTGALTQNGASFSLTGTGTSSLTAGGSLNLSAAGGSTFSTTAGNLTFSTTAASGEVLIQAPSTGAIRIGDNFAPSVYIGTNNDNARTVSIASANSGTVATVNIGSNGTVNIGANGSTNYTNTTNINTTSSATGTQIVNIGSSAKAANALLFEAGNTGKIQIGNGATAHTIQIGTDSTAIQTVSLGSTNTSSTTTIQGGTGNINLVTNNASASTIVKSNTNSVTAFQVQNAASGNVLNVDTTTGRVTISQGGLTILGLANPATPTLALTSTTGTLANATTYTYRLAAISGAGETQAIPTSPASTTTVNATSKNTITWSAVPNATGYKLYRSINGGTTWFVNTLGAVTSAVDDGTNFTWATSPPANYPSFYENRTGDVKMNDGASLFLNAYGDGKVKYDNVAKNLVVGSYAAGGTVTLQGDQLIFEDTTGYTNSFVINNIGATTFQNRTNSSTAFQVQNATNTSLFNVDTANTLVTIGASSQLDVFTKLADPGTLPGATGHGTAWSPDGQYMSVASTSSPYITIYKRSGDTFTKLADPGTLPGSTSNGTAWSPDSQYLTVATTSTPYVTIYKRSGDTFTKLADPGTLPASGGNGTAWSPDGTYMTVASTNSPYITIYKRSGDTFTKLTNPGTLPGATGNVTAWSPDGTYMSVASASTPYITIYKRSGDTFTKLADPGTLPAGAADGTAWSPDGTYMTVSHATTPFVTIYKVNKATDTFTKLADPGTLPANAGHGTAWSPDGQYMSVAHAASPYITIYKVNKATDTFTKLADPGTLPLNFGEDSAWSPDGQYLSVAMTSSPYVTIYKHGTSTTINGSLQVNNGIAVAGRVSGVDAINANEYATLGQVSALMGSGGVLLQAATPGTQQIGHMNISGYGIFGVAVGIGGTPTEKLHIQGSNTSGRILSKIENTNGAASSKSSGIQLVGGTTVDWTIGTDVGLNGGNNFAIQDNKFGYQPRLMIDSNGQVGFGTDAPSASLSFATGANRTINVNTAASGNGGNSLTLQGGSGNGTNQPGGNLILQGGAATGSGAGGVVIVKSQTNSTTAFQIQSSTSAVLFTADTSGSTITFGNSGNTMTIGSTGEPILAGTARHSKKIILTPEYAGASLDVASDTGGSINCNTNNNGTMTSGFDATARQNYYNWTSASGTGQCYDVVIQVPIPSDWVAWNGQGSMYVYNSVGSDGTSVMVDGYDTNGNHDSGFSINAYTGLTSSTTFTFATLPTLNGTYAADGYMTFKVRMTSSSNKNVRIGNITLNYYSKY